ncbi:MAG: hypothetical protein WC823_07025 [Parcubacteria group bacterium]|jgi:hypothetical protein
MTEKEKYKMAIQLMSKEKESRKKSAVIFDELVEKANDNTIRMQSILYLVVLLNAVDHNSRIIAVCDKGLTLGKKLNDYGSVAYLMSIKAKCLEEQASLCNYEKHSLSSSLGWFNYSLESDREKADIFDKKGAMLEEQSKILIDDAIKMAEKIQRHDALANILMMSGEIYGGMYLTGKIRKMKKPKLYLFLNKFHLDDFYMRFIEGDGETWRCIKKSEALLLRASQIFESLGNQTNQAYAFYNLANQLRLAREFRKAKKYLEKARSIAQIKNDIPLLESIVILEETIRAKNKDVPDYINGERRAD